MPRSPGHGFGPGELLLILDGPGKLKGSARSLVRVTRVLPTHPGAQARPAVPPLATTCVPNTTTDRPQQQQGSDPTFWALDSLICLAGLFLACQQEQ